MGLGHSGPLPVLGLFSVDLVDTCVLPPSVYLWRIYFCVPSAINVVERSVVAHAFYNKQGQTVRMTG